jgi:hypothetical protein
MPRLLFDELKSMCEAQQPHNTLCPKENLKVERESIESRVTHKLPSMDKAIDGNDKESYYYVII